MTYWTTESNRLTDDNKPRSGHLIVTVYNDAETPARDVLVVIDPISPAPEIKCTENYKVQDGIRGQKLVTLGRIPAKTKIEIHVDESVNEYPDRMNVFGGRKYQYSADVGEVQTEFGTIRKNFMKCENNFQRLPDDPPSESPWGL